MTAATRTTRATTGTEEIELSASLSTGRVLLIGGASAVFVALSVTAQTYLSMLGHGHSFWRILWWQLSVAGLWALFAPILVRVGARLHGTGANRPVTWLTVAVYGAGAIALHIVITAQLSIWLRPFVPVVVSDFLLVVRAQFESQFATDILVFAMLLVAGRTAAISERARRSALRESRLEAELARANLEALRLEIQPHFLFNTLNSIAALIRMQANGKALDMLLGLGALMRATIDRPPDHLTTLATEVDFVKQYLDLQAVRFGDRLDVGIAVDPESIAVMVPSFLLQPLVENALRHGVARKPGRARIDLTATLDADRLVIEVTDDGAGLASGFDLERDAGTGLRNIRGRLQQLYGTAARLTIASRPSGGTCVRVELPASKDTATAKVSA
ncbi:MAG: sensor histidine kinase [Vicinamibacterales bacterium]